MRSVLSLFITGIILFAAGVSAQSNTSVEVRLSQPAASQGDIITADINIIDGVAVGGADMTVRVDPTCLRILERIPGNYLPDTASGSSFSAASKVSDYEARLALALTDRTRHANGSGTFFTLQLEVTCETGAANVVIEAAQVTSYIDPDAEIIEVTSFELEDNTLTATNAQLTIGPAAQATAIPTTAPAATAEATPAPTTAPATPDAPTVAPQSNSTVLILIVVLVMVILVGGILYALTRYMRRR